MPDGARASPGGAAGPNAGAVRKGAASEPGPARMAAFEVRRQVERGRRLDRAFAAATRGLDPRDRAFAHELAWGTTRLRGRLDHLLGRHLARPRDALDPALLEVLRLGAYQALYMDAVPDFAAVSASVDLARGVGVSRAAGLVNAVLRRVVEDGDGRDRFPDPAVDPLGYLETRGSHPRWLLERWAARLDGEELAALVAANNRRPPTWLATRTDPSEALERLAEAGIAAEPVEIAPGDPGSGHPAWLRLPAGASPADALAAVLRSWIQDPAAGLVVRYADIDEGARLADLCAAPGGKALGLAGRAGYLIAADRSPPRLRLVRENARRAGLEDGGLALVLADAAHPPLRPLDAVLLDVPCSGTGTLARHPDARWRLRPSDIRTFADLQERLLDAAADVVRPGGLLVYSTCTLEPEENADRIEAFLGKHRNFRIEETPAAPRACTDGRGLLGVTPYGSGFDGAFAARMRRTE